MEQAELDLFLLSDEMLVDGGEDRFWNCCELEQSEMDALIKLEASITVSVEFESPFKSLNRLSWYFVVFVKLSFFSIWSNSHILLVTNA